MSGLLTCCFKVEGKRERQRRCPRYGSPYDPEEAERAKKAPPRPTYLELLRDHFHETGEATMYYNEQGWAKEWTLGCVNPASWLPLAVGGEFTQLRVQPCIIFR